MGLALLIIGLLMIITGARGTYGQFGSQLTSEFTGQNSFTYQAVALGSIGALGYIPALQVISRWALALILLVLIINNKQGSFIGQFQSALANGPTPPQPLGSTSAATASPTLPQTAVNAVTGNNPGSSAIGQMVAPFSGPVNQWLQSLPGIGSWFAPAH